MEVGDGVETGISKREAARRPWAVAVEFALLVPLLVVILFAIISVGIALFRVVNYTSAAREGARYAAVHCRPEAAVCTQDLIVARVTQAPTGVRSVPGLRPQTEIAPSRRESPSRSLGSRRFPCTSRSFRISRSR
jgi:hypothetical protein